MDGCCKANLQACDANTIMAACWCGFGSHPCAASCTDLCAGKPPTLACGICLLDTHCGMVWYDFNYDAQTPNFTTCMDCDGQSCNQTCCSQYASSCKHLNDLEKCACTD